MKKLICGWLLIKHLHHRAVVLPCPIDEICYAANNDHVHQRLTFNRLAPFCNEGLPISFANCWVEQAELRGVDCPTHQQVKPMMTLLAINTDASRHEKEGIRTAVQVMSE